MWCNSDEENDKERAEPDVDYSPAGVAHIESEAKDLVARCLEKMGQEFLANVGTVSVAKDLESMRVALGDDKPIEVSVKDGGTQIEYEDEDPKIHEYFESCLHKVGATCRMNSMVPWCTRNEAAGTAALFAR